MATIGAADYYGLPVSTMRILSSGVAGIMWANNSGCSGPRSGIDHGMGVDLVRLNGPGGGSLLDLQQPVGKELEERQEAVVGLQAFGDRKPEWINEATSTVFRK